jgi:hypothetical protein
MERVHETIVAMENQQVLHTYVCVGALACVRV